MCLEHSSTLPYSGKLLREKTFAFRYKTRILRRKLSRIAPVQLLCRCGPRACATYPHTCNVRIADCKIFWRKLSRMVLKPRKTRKFSPSKVFRFTVSATHFNTTQYMSLYTSMEIRTCTCTYGCFWWFDHPSLILDTVWNQCVSCRSGLGIIWLAFYCLNLICSIFPRIEDRACIFFRDLFDTASK